MFCAWRGGDRWLLTNRKRMRRPRPNRLALVRLDDLIGVDGKRVVRVECQQDVGREGVNLVLHVAPTQIVEQRALVQEHERTYHTWCSEEVAYKDSGQHDRAHRSRTEWHTRKIALRDPTTDRQDTMGDVTSVRVLAADLKKIMD